MMYNCQILHCQACNCGNWGSVLEELVQRRWLRRCSDDRAVQPWHCRRKQETELFHSTLICTFSTQWPPVDNVQCDAVRRHRGDTGECSNPVRTGLVSFSVTKIVRGWLNLVLVFFHPLCSSQYSAAHSLGTMGFKESCHGLFCIWKEGKPAPVDSDEFFWVPKVGVIFEPKIICSVFFVCFWGYFWRKKCGRRCSQEFKPGLYCRCFIFCF